MKWAGLVALLPALAACVGGGAGTTTARIVSVQEQQCRQAGWRSESLVVAGLSRGVLWKAPAGVWARGALVVLHGGGGQHANFCAANVDLIAAQVRLTDMALAQGFAVFLLDSTDRVTDTEGRRCGKVWDDEVRPRDNLDLPFIEEVLRRLIPAARPAGSRADLYLTGLSSGGYMAVRAATRFGDLVSAFAPVASGDPDGWVRDCTPRAGDRSNVFGVGRDAQTRLAIGEIDGRVSEGALDATLAARQPEHLMTRRDQLRDEPSANESIASRDGNAHVSASRGEPCIGCRSTAGTPPR